MSRFCVRDEIYSRRRKAAYHAFTRLLRPDILPHVARLNDELARASIPLIILPG
jgi:hypothetical protein